MRFKLNDKVIIYLRDETVEGLVSFIGNHEFTVVNFDGGIIGTLSNDVGNYVQVVPDMTEGDEDNSETTEDNQEDTNISRDNEE